MIDARIQITDETPEEQAEQLLERARALGKPAVRVEVEYPAERDLDVALDLPAGSTWAVSGDAVEVDFTVTPPIVSTLPPYSEVTP